MLGKAVANSLFLCCCFLANSIELCAQQSNPTNQTWISAEAPAREPSAFKVRSIQTTTPGTSESMQANQRSVPVDQYSQNSTGNQQLTPHPTTLALPNTENTVRSMSVAERTAKNQSQTNAQKKKLPIAKQTSLTPQNASGSGWKTLVTTGSALLIVIALFVAFAILTRRGLQTTRGKLPKQVFDVLGRTSYAPRQQVLVVRFGHKILLINHEHGNVQTLSEIDTPEEVDRIVGFCEQQSSNSISSSFSSVLSQVMSGNDDRASERRSGIARTLRQPLARKVA